MAFWAGRRYIVAVNEDCSSRDPHRQAVLARLRCDGRRSSKEYTDLGTLRRPRAVPVSKQDVAVGTSDGSDADVVERSASKDDLRDCSKSCATSSTRLPNSSDANSSTCSDTDASTTWRRVVSPIKEDVTRSRQTSGLRHMDTAQFEALLQDRGPLFSQYAKLAFIGLAIACIAECYFLQHWEAGIFGARDDEVDVFRSKPYFISYTPDLSRWRLKRIVFGSWRDLIYMAFIYPAECGTVIVAIGALYAVADRLKLSVLTNAIFRLGLGALSYFVYVGAHRVYFALVCLIICWECRELELKTLAFAKTFATLTTHQRWHWHVDLGSEIKALDARLAPLIRYACIERITYLALDLARQSCEVSLPFNIVHYLFRHVMFLAALVLAIWRIGKLNFSFYEKLHNSLADLFPRNWADLGHTPGVTTDEVVLQRQHLDDWRHYLEQQIGSGRREACVCVLNLRWAAKSHVLALSIITVLTLPLMNKTLDSYGRHVVNERWLRSSPVDTMPFLDEQTQRVDATCAREPS